MSQDKVLLYDIEKQNTDKEQNGVEMKSPSRNRSILSLIHKSKSIVKVFSPPSADTLPEKLRLNRNRLSYSTRDTETDLVIEKEDGSIEENLQKRRNLGSKLVKAKSLKSFEGMLLT